MYEVYMAEVLSRSEEELITRTIERRRVALERGALAPAPGAARAPRAVRGVQTAAPCVGCPA